MKETSGKLFHDERLDLGSNRIHIVSDQPNDFEVWLNTDVSDYDGLCIGCGSSRTEAVADAIGVFEQGLEKLKNSR